MEGQLYEDSNDTYRLITFSPPYRLPQPPAPHFPSSLTPRPLFPHFLLAFLYLHHLLACSQLLAIPNSSGLDALTQRVKGHLMREGMRGVT